MLALLDGKESGQPTKAMADMPDSVKGLLHTATADNGKEFAEHKEIAGVLARPQPGREGLVAHEKKLHAQQIPGFPKGTNRSVPEAYVRLPCA